MDPEGNSGSPSSPRQLRDLLGVRRPQILSLDSAPPAHAVPHNAQSLDGWDYARSRNHFSSESHSVEHKPFVAQEVDKLRAERLKASASSSRTWGTGDTYSLAWGNSLSFSTF